MSDIEKEIYQMRIAALRLTLLEVKAAIMNDKTAIVDTFWMPDEIIKGCTVCDYIDISIAADDA